MADTTSYGYKIPRNPDKGSTFFTQLEDNIQRVNDHSHNGVNSAPLAKTQSISSASWGADLGGGRYKQTITLTGSLTYDTIVIQIRLSSGHIIHPTIEKVSGTSYDVYVNDNSLNLTAVYI